MGVHVFRFQVADALKEDFLSVRDFLLDDFPGAQRIVQSLEAQQETDEVKDNGGRHPVFCEVEQGQDNGPKSSWRKVADPGAAGGEERGTEGGGRKRIEKDAKDVREEEAARSEQTQRAGFQTAALSDYTELVLSQESILTANCGCNFFLFFFFLLNVARQLLLPRLRKHLRLLQSADGKERVSVHSTEQVISSAKEKSRPQFSARSSTPFRSSLSPCDRGACERTAAPPLTSKDASASFCLENASFARREDSMEKREREESERTTAAYGENRRFKEESFLVLVAFDVLGALRVCNLLKALCRAGYLAIITDAQLVRETQAHAKHQQGK